jgi:hypothetical protein
MERPVMSPLTVGQKMVVQVSPAASMMIEDGEYG